MRTIISYWFQSQVRDQGYKTSVILAISRHSAWHHRAIKSMPGFLSEGNSNPIKIASVAQQCSEFITLKSERAITQGHPAKRPATVTLRNTKGKRNAASTQQACDPWQSALQDGQSVGRTHILSSAAKGQEGTDRETSSPILHRANDQ